MSLSREQVEKVSLLARLRLSDAELETMTRQLGQIVAYVEQLAEFDTDDVEPMAHAVELANVFRPDELRPSFDRAAMLASARTPTASAIWCRPCWASEVKRGTMTAVGSGVPPDCCSPPSRRAGRPTPNTSNRRPLPCRSAT